jgi:hypothetical protein
MFLSPALKPSEHCVIDRCQSLRHRHVAQPPQGMVKIGHSNILLSSHIIRNRPRDPSVKSNGKSRGYGLRRVSLS